MNEQDRHILIRYRIEQAEETISLAKFLLENGKMAVTMNRIYYGMFYALSALALKDSFETSKHLQMIGWFNKNYVLTNKTNEIHGKALRRAFQNRTKGDYDVFVTFEAEEITTMITEMESFINEIKRLVQASEQ
jgi:uncharacterized protein (UPF0332 family)